MIFFTFVLFFSLTFSCVAGSTEPGLFTLEEEWRHDSFTCTATGSSQSDDIRFVGLPFSAHPRDIGTQTFDSATSSDGIRNSSAIDLKSVRSRRKTRTPLVGNESFSSNEISSSGSVPSIFNASFNRKHEDDLFPME